MTTPGQAMKAAVERGCFLCTRRAKVGSFIKVSETKVMAIAFCTRCANIGNVNVIVAEKVMRTLSAGQVESQGNGDVAP